jgi:TetR/AcrR family transcriptional repressor of nem operon
VITESTPPELGRSRGRPREFDVDVVLDQIVELFWVQGFEATSMSDIVEATGLNKSSLYNSFGSKEQLFQAALDRYTSMREGLIRSALRDGTAGLDDIMMFLDMVELEMTSEFGSRGCLAINTSTELGHVDQSVVEMGTRFRGEMRSAISAALDRAAALGEIDRNAIAHRAESVVAFMMSLGVVARSGAPRAELDGQLAAMRALVESWRITH